jgi:hypothetical protein
MIRMQKYPISATSGAWRRSCIWAVALSLLPFHCSTNDVVATGALTPLIDASFDAGPDPHHDDLTCIDATSKTRDPAECISWETCLVRNSEPPPKKIFTALWEFLSRRLHMVAFACVGYEHTTVRDLRRGPREGYRTATRRSDNGQGLLGTGFCRKRRILPRQALQPSERLWFF